MPILFLIIGGALLLGAKANRKMNRKLRVFIGLLGMFTIIYSFLSIFITISP